jgi:hypothetical protein
VPTQDDLRTVAIAGIAASLSLLVTVELHHVKVRTLASLCAVVACLLIARRRWGGFAVVAPVFLDANPPEKYGIPGSLQLALLTLVLAVVFWDKIGRPAIARPPLLTAGVFGIVLLGTNIGAGAGVDNALWLVLLAFAGVLYGHALQVSSEARASLAVFSIPLALLPIGEILGLHNPWPDLVHSGYAQASLETGALRGQSTFGQPLIAGGCLAAMAALAFQSKVRHATPLALVLACGAVATVSRSAIIGLAVGLTVAVIIGPHRLMRLAQTMVIVIVGAVALVVVPPLHTSFVNRTSNPDFTNQTVRNYALTRIRADWAHQPMTLLIGRGTQGSYTLLHAIGGVNGGFIFDNQYVTAVYDFGLLPLICVIGVMLFALSRGRSAGIRRGLPAFAVVVVVMFFTDGLGWMSLTFVAWLVFGLTTAPNLPQSFDGRRASRRRYPAIGRSETDKLILHAP